MTKHRHFASSDRNFILILGLGAHHGGDEHGKAFATRNIVREMCASQHAMVAHLSRTGEEFRALLWQYIA
jgi:hypothetical protein